MNRATSKKQFPTRVIHPHCGKNVHCSLLNKIFSVKAGSISKLSKRLRDATPAQPFNSPLGPRANSAVFDYVRVYQNPNDRAAEAAGRAASLRRANRPESDKDRNVGEPKDLN